jgi:hypothetical protein
MQFWDPHIAPHTFTQLARVRRAVANAGEVQEGLVDAKHADAGDRVALDRHDACTHVAIKG